MSLGTNSHPMYYEGDLSSENARVLRTVQELTKGYDAVVAEEDAKGTAITLSPQSQGAAASVTFFVDTPKQVSCHPGAQGMDLEFCSDDFDEILIAITEIVTAILEGSYKEYVKKGADPNYPKIVASWPDSTCVRRESRLNTGLGVVAASNWLEHAYEPYTSR